MTHETVTGPSAVPRTGPGTPSWIPDDRLGQRLARLAAGLLLYGFSDGLILLGALGVDPWDVLHQGLARTVGLRVGTWAIVIGALVLLAWWPLRERPGLGTVLNVVVVGLTINATLALLPEPHTSPRGSW